MKVARTIILCLFLHHFSLQLRAQSISIDDTKNAAELVNLLTQNSSCLQIANESVSGDTFTPGKNSYGTFSNSSANFPFQSGIVLSSWSSTQSAGPFVRTSGEGSDSWLGDTDLDQTLNINSVNATVLEFDFTPQTNAISFNYLFASNEYQDDYPCRFSDGFAFLIKEKNSTNPYRNLAVIPNSTTPVSSTNIHPAIAFVDPFGNVKSCTATNASFFGQFNNTPNNSSPINYAGQTKVLNARTNVIPGTTYHIKLVVADDRNPLYDSAIFIEAASFNSVIDLGADKLLATNNAICFGENYIIDTQLSATFNYKWYKDGVLLATETNPSYTVTAAGTYKVEVTLTPSGCVASNEIKIEYTPEIVLNDYTLMHCDFDGDGKEVFDLSQADDFIKNNDTTLSNVIYYENSSDAQSDSNPILSPSNYINQSPNQTLIAKVTNSYNCANYAELTLKISNDNIPNQTAIITGVQTHDFDGNNNTVVIEYSGSGNYEFSIDGDFYQDNPEFFNLSAGSYTAYARDKNDCSESIPFPFIILDYPRFFTPNSDGFNDTWTIKNLNTLPQATIAIFDRYGKLLKQFNSSNLNWNGTFNGHLLPADDYWFYLIFEDGKNIKGHFSLKR